MKRILTAIALLMTAAAVGQSYYNNYTKPYFQDNVKIKDSIEIEGRFLINDIEPSWIATDDTGDTSRYWDGTGYFNIADYGVKSSDVAQDVHGDLTLYGATTISDDVALTGDIAVTGTLSGAIGYIADADQTPDVSGYNVFKYNGWTADTLSDLDNPTVGAVYTIIGNGHSLVIPDGSNFDLNDTVTLGKNDAIQLLCVADNEYVQIAPYVANSYYDDDYYDYFVSTAGDNGNDGLTVATAFKTIAKAEATATDGQKVRVLPGTYDIPSITFDQAIEWDGYGAILTDSSTVTAAWITISTTDTKHFRGFVFNSNTAATYMFNIGNTSDNLYFENCAIWTNQQVDYTFGSAAGTGDVSFNNCYISSGSTTMLHLFYGSSANFENCTIDSLANASGYYFYKYTATGAGDITVTNCKINWGTGVLLYTRNNGTVTFDNCEITTTGSLNTFFSSSTGTTGDKDLYIINSVFNINNSFSGSAVINESATTTAFDTIVISNNTFTCHADVNEILISGHPTDYYEISNNTFIYNNVTGGAIIYPSSAGTTDVFEVLISGNKIYQKNIAGYSIFVGADTQNNDDVITGTVEKNMLYGYLYYNPLADISGVTCHGIAVGYQNGVAIKNNYVNGYYFGVALKDDGTNYNSVISYNVIENVDQGLRMKGSGGAEFYNNTVIINTQGSNGTGYPIYIGVNDSNENSDSVTFKNNILYMGTGISSAIVTAGADQGIDNVYDCNLCYSYDDEDIKYEEDGTVYTGWAAVQAAGYETNGVNENPQFGTGYRLKLNSPAFNAGINTGYNTGLSRKTIWGTKVYTTNQGINKTIGAYID